MTECEHEWVYIDEDYEGDLEEGPYFTHVLSAHKECVLCGETDSNDELDELDEENQNV